MVHRFDVLPSTQDALHELAQAGSPAGTAVVAGAQTLGRGSRGREWASPPGGLWLSVLCRPEGEPAMEVLSLRVAMSVAATIERLSPGVALQLKWPNDLMLGGRKLGGILCEARWHGAALGWVAIGLGINVSNPIPDALADSAIALATAAPGVAPDALAAPLAAAIAEAGSAQGLLTPEELESFRARDWLRGKRISVPAPGLVEGIASDGSLLVRTANGSTTRFRSGTVLLAE